jgi:hypothetical protein
MNSLNLKILWKARFDNGLVIYQKDSHGVEHSFQEVKDNFSHLKVFTFYHIAKPLEVSVDLERGLIFINNKQQQIVNQDLIYIKKNIRLICFRRHRVKIENKSLKQTEHDIYYFIGYQYQDQHDKNRKVLLQVDQEGNIIIGD